MVKNTEKVIIVGAPRSGTNMLRDVLTSFDGVATWPCDEINYIWRHGNIRYPSDEFPPHLAKPAIKKYVRRRFQEIAESTNAQVVIEKTCANSLRVPFVDSVLPEAKYIYIYRDGLDATGSAKLRWTAKLDVPYILEKVRFVPKLDLPYYALRYFSSRVYRFFSREKRLAFWGPSLEGMQEILERHTLNEVCALQWQRCVEKAESAFLDMPDKKVLHVCYEEFVRNPNVELARILAFIGREASSDEVEQAVKEVSISSLGKGRKALCEKEAKRLESLVEGPLKRYGYL